MGAAVVSALVPARRRQYKRFVVFFCFSVERAVKTSFFDRNGEVATDRLFSSYPIAACQTSFEFVFLTRPRLFLVVGREYALDYSVCVALLCPSPCGTSCSGVERLFVASTAVSRERCCCVRRFTVVVVAPVRVKQPNL